MDKENRHDVFSPPSYNLRLVHNFPNVPSDSQKESPEKHSALYQSGHDFLLQNQDLPKDLATPKVCGSHRITAEQRNQPQCYLKPTVHKISPSQYSRQKWIDDMEGSRKVLDNFNGTNSYKNI